MLMGLVFMLIMGSCVNDNVELPIVLVNNGELPLMLNNGVLTISVVWK